MNAIRTAAEPLHQLAFGLLDMSDTLTRSSDVSARIFHIKHRDALQALIDWIPTQKPTASFKAVREFAETLLCNTNLQQPVCSPDEADATRFKLAKLYQMAVIASDKQQPKPTLSGSYRSLIEALLQLGDILETETHKLYFDFDATHLPALKKVIEWLDYNLDRRIAINAREAADYIYTSLTWNGALIIPMAPTSFLEKLAELQYIVLWLDGVIISNRDKTLEPCCIANIADAERPATSKRQQDHEALIQALLSLSDEVFQHPHQLYFNFSPHHQSTLEAVLDRLHGHDFGKTGANAIMIASYLCNTLANKKKVMKANDFILFMQWLAELAFMVQWIINAEIGREID